MDTTAAIESLLRRRIVVGGLAALPFVGANASADAPPALLLARDAPPDIDPRGWLVSEKFDGVRALWDGQRLRLRSGLAVDAPAAFVARLPSVALDGELWLGRGRFDDVSALVRRGAGNAADVAAWRDVRFLAFELPRGGGGYADRAREIERLAAAAAPGPLVAVAQQRVATPAELRRRLDTVVADGGEGLMLHHADAPVVAGRSGWLLKLKPVHDADAVVVAHLPGRGRHAGRLGALRVRNAAGVEFDVGSGYTDAERAAPPPIGATISYRHRGHTPRGVPRFATYLRRRW